MNDGISVDPDAVRSAAEEWLSVRDITLNANSDGMRYPSTTAGARHDELPFLRLSDVLDQVDDSWAEKCQSVGDDAIDFRTNLRGYADSIEQQDADNAGSIPVFTGDETPEPSGEGSGHPDEPQPVY